jgi:hypothetical protein
MNASGEFEGRIASRTEHFYPASMPAPPDLRDTREMFTAFDTPLLAEAFPAAWRDEALPAGAAVCRTLHPTQWSERFPVRVMEETVLIPARLHFATIGPPLPLDDMAGLMARALQTSSNDGYERQRAARDVMVDLRPWSAPFIVALIGEYIDRILIDIEAALTPERLRALTEFVAANPLYWETTKRRVMSYWSVYYRATYRRSDYAGFRIVERIEAGLAPASPSPQRRMRRG